MTDATTADIAAEALESTAPESLDALRRTLNYLAAAQLYLRDNVGMTEPLRPEHVKTSPQGHWGVCPPVNLALTLIAPLQRAVPEQVSVLHGAGHAGPSALGYAYLTSRLGQRWPNMLPSAAGLHRLISGFPHPGWLGGEITALIPGQSYMGGQIGPALAVAAGGVLGNPNALAIPLIGDGECETGLAAAAWLGQRSLARTTEDNGAVLPVVLINGLRMGGASLLGQMSPLEQDSYFKGLGYAPVRIDGRDMSEARNLFARAVTQTGPVGRRSPTPVVLITVAKGASGPVSVGPRTILGTPAVHKCPLTDPATNREEFLCLQEWLTSYHPAELLTSNGAPVRMVADILPQGLPSSAVGSVLPPGPGEGAESLPLGATLAEVLNRWAAADPRFRIFSPDELSSNHIRFRTGDAAETAVTEILNEELCHAWLQGLLESGGNGVFISYEAFASINQSLLVQYLLHRALAAGETASINYVLTSLGWNNCYTHQNPGLMSAMIETGSPMVRIYTPADARRAGSVLDLMLRSKGLANVVIADKYSAVLYPLATVQEEITQGAAIWPEYSDQGPADLVLAGCGDLATRQLLGAASLLRARQHPPRLRFVQVCEMTALGAPGSRPHALPTERFEEIFPPSVPVLLVTPGYAGAVRGILSGRPAHRFSVSGFRHPPHPMPPADLLAYCQLDASALAAEALHLLGVRTAGDRSHSSDRPLSSIGANRE